MIFLSEHVLFKNIRYVPVRLQVLAILVDYIIMFIKIRIF